MTALIVLYEGIASPAPYIVYMIDFGIDDSPYLFNSTNQGGRPTVELVLIFVTNPIFISNEKMREK